MSTGLYLTVSVVITSHNRNGAKVLFTVVILPLAIIADITERSVELLRGNKWLNWSICHLCCFNINYFFIIDWRLAVKGNDRCGDMVDDRPCLTKVTYSLLDLKICRF